MTSTKMRHYSLLLLGTAALLVCPRGAWAQATRTWVSGVGDDANPCSRTAPCKTFAGAISKTATSGEINILDPGGYGSVTITKSITIDGGGSFGSILASGTNGIVISLSSTTDSVVLRNLSINGAGTGINGIRMTSGGSLYVDHVQIQQFTGKGIDLEPTAAAKLFLADTEIRNTGGGVYLKPTATTITANLDRLLVESNTFGVRAEDGTSVSMRDVTAAGNLNSGFYAISWTQPVDMSIEAGSAVSQKNGTTNSSGVRAEGAQARVRICNLSVFNNDVGLNIVGGTLASCGTNRVFSNSVNGAPNATVVLQ